MFSVVFSYVHILFTISRPSLRRSTRHRRGFIRRHLDVTDPYECTDESNKQQTCDESLRWSFVGSANKPESERGDRKSAEPCSNGSRPPRCPNPMPGEHTRSDRNEDESEEHANDAENKRKSNSGSEDACGKPSSGSVDFWIVYPRSNKQGETDRKYAERPAGDGICPPDDDERKDARTSESP